MRKSVLIDGYEFRNKADVERFLKKNHIHISDGNMKLDKIPNFNCTPGVCCSPDAAKTCHSGFNVDGTKCNACYACKAYKLYPTCRTAWNENVEALLFEPELLEIGLKAYLNFYTGRFFRIHAAGDFATKDYALMWKRVMLEFPHIRFLAFTKQYKIVRDIGFEDVPNFCLLPSERWGLKVPVELESKFKKAITIHRGDDVDAGVFICPGSCKDCKVCWELNDLQYSAVGFHEH